MKVSFERRDGRITQSEYRVVVEVGGRAVSGEWCYTKADARKGAEALRRSLFDAEEAERVLEAESARRVSRIHALMETDRRPTSWGIA